jgi:hypothetical protein
VRKLTIAADGRELKLESPRIGQWHGAGVARALAAQ